jgi:ankyrin repeat protein
MKHVSLFLTAFGLWFFVGCRWNPTGDPGAPARATPPPQAPQSRAERVEELKEPTTKDLRAAAMRGNVNDVKVYVQRDPEAVRRPDAQGFYPIHRAADQGHSEVIRVLLGAGADVNTPHATVQATPLEYAAMNGHLDAVRTLMAAGAMVDSVDIAGRTPLMWAAWKGKAEVVQELLKHGADVSRKNKTGGTALYYAEQNGYAQIAELLRK